MSRNFETDTEPKDRTRQVWLGISGLFVLMIIGLWWTGRPDTTSSTVRAQHLLIKFDKADPVDRQRALEQISELRERIQNGESFAKLAQDYSNDPFSAARGGDLGYSDRGAYEDTFERYVWSAPVGELSEIVTTSYGFHLIQVMDRYISEAEQYENYLDDRAREELRKRNEASDGTESETP